jgi:hypothetical protein
VPEPPVDLSGAALEAWSAWFGSWWAWFWQPEDVPSLRMIIGLFDQVHRGSLDSSKLMPWMDRFGLTPKGRQDLRWQPQEAAKPEPEVADEVATKRAARRGRIA